MRDASLSELKAFDATARCGSMSAPARAWGQPQPTGSAHIARIESHHGIELFRRQRFRQRWPGVQPAVSVGGSRQGAAQVPLVARFPAVVKALRGPLGQPAGPGVDRARA